jgi:hypothetical protein
MALPQQSKTKLGSLKLKKWAWFIVSSNLNLWKGALGGSSVVQQQTTLAFWILVKAVWNSGVLGNLQSFSDQLVA